MNKTGGKWWTQLPAVELIKAIDKILLAFGEDAGDIVARINSDSESVFLKRLAKFAKNGGIEPTVSQELALDIMGKDYITVDEGIRHLKLDLSSREFASLAEVPYSKECLLEAKGKCKLVAFPEISISEMCRRVPELFNSRKGGWYSNLPFVNYRGEVGHYLVYKEPVETEEINRQVPVSPLLVYTVIMSFLSNEGERLLKDTWARCADTDSDRRITLEKGRRHFNFGPFMVEVSNRKRNPRPESWKTEEGRQIAVGQFKERLNIDRFSNRVGGIRFAQYIN